MKNIGWYNGEVKPLEQLKISALDRCVYFGDGVYDAAYARGGRAHRLDDHVGRLLLCAKGVDIVSPYSKEEIKSIVDSLLAAGECENYFIYMQLSRGIAIRDHFPSVAPNGSLLIMLYEKKVDERVRTLKMTTVDDLRHGYCRYKTLNLLSNVMAMGKAEKEGSDGVIFINDKYVTECANANVFIISNGVLMTPPANGCLLEGVQRKVAIEKCKEAGFECVEREITYCELMNADEVIVTSAGRLFNRVSTVNGIPVGGRGGALFDRVQDAIFNDFEQAVK